ncbi:type II secretion system protein GspC [Teredinibacter turnerae]|uniref:type II secretion system protein GspC n=1 Tax=Teredinibacter turnerae TaxID=2426 RepID=UPI0003646315|nr:type II secretion system protein GspC [Teredinibacter turnerae]
MATSFADNPVLFKANRFGSATYGYLRSLPLDFWRNAVFYLSILWIVHSLAGFFWLVFPVPAEPQPSKLAAPIKVESSAVAAGVDVDVAALQEMKIFGDAANAPVDVAPESEPVVASDGIEDNASTTSLNLKLHGVIASSNQEEARAIIDNGSEQGLFRIGEEIPKNAGVKLAKVMEERVILDNKGKYESLWLYSEEDFKKSQGNRKNNYRVPTSPAQSGSPVTQRPEPVRKSISPQQIPKSISDVVRFSVHREDGRMVGYKIRPGRDRELFEQVGLKAGDIVTNVNGRTMNDPRQLREVYQELKTATEANLGVRRGDEELQITIRVDNGG